MEFRNITDIGGCRVLWEKFSPKSSVWDIWDIAYAFNKGYDAEPFFIVGSEKGIDKAILHLQAEGREENRFFDFFGGNYPERRKFYIKDTQMIPGFLAQAPEDTYLDYIDDGYKRLQAFAEDEAAFSLNLKKFDYSLASYLQTFNKKHRKNLNYDLRQLEKTDYRLVWNAKSHLARLAGLNRMKFGEESNFEEQQFMKSMQLMVDSAEKLNLLHMLSIKISSKVEASQIALFHNKIYTVLTGGSNPEIKNLGKLLIVEHIRRAAELKADTVDFMTAESGWKRLWKLDETMLYKFDK
jgi:uncharacterized protein YozE (UPF0346 family)